MRLGLPRDFDELVRFHGGWIAALAGAENVLIVAHHLWYRGILEAFKPPREITRDQVVGYLGISFPAWHVAVRQLPQHLPRPIEGSLKQPESKYLFSDAERCFARRDPIFPRLRRAGFFRSLVPGFEAFLTNEVKKLVEEFKLGYIFDVPLHLPQNDAEMMAAHSATVVRVVRNRLKYGMEVEDAISEVWLKLLSSNLPVKFMRSGPNRLPTQMTTDEVLDYLGVDEEAWQQMIATYSEAPNPIKGAAGSLDALYRAEDIRVLDASGFFEKRSLRFLPAWSVSKELFDKYVATATDHALKNIFRSLDRRFNREDTLQTGACIQDNRRVRVLSRDDVDFAWEDTLSSSGSAPLSGSGISMIPADALVDIKRRVAVGCLIQGP
jgi:hypothetical protein